MVAFIIRRLFGMILVLLAVSFIVYLIFIVIPGGDPAQRIAGKVATAPGLSLFPGIAIAITVLAINVFGDGLRDALDPRAKIRIEHG